MALVACLVFPCAAQGAHKKTPVRVQPDRSASLVVEADTGLVLHARNALALRHPASLTKMMTLYLVFQAIEEGRITLETTMPVSRLAAQQAPTKIGLEEGQKLRVGDAIMSLVTLSANDAAVVLAEALGGSLETFVAQMNVQARALGMRQTVFRNPSGLPDKRQVTTARDMAVLAHALIDHYPGFYPYFSRKSYVYEGRVFQSHNRLLDGYEGADGIKTGYTGASGFNLASSATRGGVRLIGIVFGGKTAASRDKEMKRLLDNAFDMVRTATVQKRLAREAKGPGYVAFSGKKGFSSPPSVAEINPSIQQATATSGGGFLIPPRDAVEAAGRFWGFQVGAFSDVATAHKALEETMRESGHFLNDAEKSLQKTTLSDGTVIYRARFTKVDRDTARSVCSHLIKGGQSCMVFSGG